MRLATALVTGSTMASEMWLATVLAAGSTAVLAPVLATVSATGSEMGSATTFATLLDKVPRRRWWRGRLWCRRWGWRRCW